MTCVVPRGLLVWMLAVVFFATSCSSGTAGPATAAPSVAPTVRATTAALESTAVPDVSPEVFEHALAPGILDGSELAQLVGGDWELSWGQVRDGDGRFDHYCDSGIDAELVDSIGIDLFYDTPELGTIAVLMRQGPNAVGLFDVFEANAACDTEVGRGVIVADVTIAGADEYVVSVFVNDSQPDFDQYVGAATARQGELVLAGSWIGASFADAESNAVRLSDILAVMLERLSAS